MNGQAVQNGMYIQQQRLNSQVKPSACQDLRSPMFLIHTFRREASHLQTKKAGSDCLSTPEVCHGDGHSRYGRPLTGRTRRSRH